MTTIWLCKALDGPLLEAYSYQLFTKRLYITTFHKFNVAFYNITLKKQLWKLKSLLNVPTNY